MSKYFCRRCFFEELDPEGVYKEIQEIIALLPERQRTDGEEYSRRLEICSRCRFLSGGTCLKCGCFAELRAAKKEMHCPHEDKLW